MADPQLEGSTALQFLKRYHINAGPIITHQEEEKEVWPSIDGVEHNVTVCFRCVYSTIFTLLPEIMSCILLLT